MKATDPNAMLTRQTPTVYDRMFAAVDKVKERLERACNALEQAGVPYAVIGGNAVAAWVATVDDGAVRNTRDVDVLLDESNLHAATDALLAAGFVRDSVMNVIVFLDGPDGKPSQGIHVLIANKKVKPTYSSPTPAVDQHEPLDGKRIIRLADLVEMKLSSFCDKDRTHLRDMIGVGLIDNTWPARFPLSLGERLQELLDDPDG